MIQAPLVETLTAWSTVVVGVAAVVALVLPILDRRRHRKSVDAAIGRQFDARVGALHSLLAKFASEPTVLGLVGMGTVVTWQMAAKPRLHLAWFLQFRWLPAAQQSRATGQMRS